MSGPKKLSKETLEEVSGGGYNPPPYFADCPFCGRSNMFSPFSLYTTPLDVGNDPNGHHMTYIAGMKIRFEKSNGDGTTETADANLYQH